MATREPVDIGYTTVAVTQTSYKSFECNRLTLINKGTQNVTIDGCFVLTPGQSITYPAWPGEINRTAYNIVFPSNVNGCLLVAICKNYS